MFTKIKQAIVKGSLKKSAKTAQYDDRATEIFELSQDAATDQNNSYYFSAHDSTASLFARLGIRGGGEHEVWFAYFNKIDGQAFVNSQTSFDKDTCPLTLKCIEPLTEWQVEFNGNLKQAKPNGLTMECFGSDIAATFKGSFVCTDKFYDFTRDSDDQTFAQAVAKEKWSKQFFAALKQNTQTHTEQGGKLCGTLTLNGKTVNIDSAAMRDHSFGKREWDYMNRHIWLMAVSKNEHLNVSFVNYPALSDLRTGYHLKDGEVVNVVQCSSQQEIAMQGVPQKFTYFAKLKNKVKMTNNCTVLAVFPFVMGGGAYTIYEGIAEFDIDNGRTKAYGIAEFGYNTNQTRWKKQK